MNKERKPLGIYRNYIKRPMDLVMSVLALILLSPLLLVVAILVKVKLGSPVIFKQRRPGLNEKIFTLYKFRSMTEKKDENGELLSDGERLTKFGKWLRATSIDELPELINIIKGEMSIVGPRPLLVEYLPLYNDHQKRRHEVRPGLSGLAQVSGRNSITWEEKFELDVEYADTIGFKKDLRIITKTMWKVIKRDGVYGKNRVAVEPFTGAPGFETPGESALKI